MSGLHTSINSHVADSFLDEQGDATPNMTYFYERVGDHPARIKNLYLLYATVLKGISLSEPTLLRREFASTDIMH